MKTEIEILTTPLRSDLTVGEVARILRCSPTQVHRLIRSGELPHYRVGRLVRVRPEWLDEFRRSRRR